MKNYQSLLYSLVLITSPLALQASNVLLCDCGHADGARSDLEYLLSPIQLSPSGMRCFLERTYNSSQYVNEVLPNGFGHVSQLLKYGQDNNHGRDYCKSVLTLFNQKIKSASYINAYSFASFLQELPSLIGYHFESNAATRELRKQQIKRVLYNTFKNEYETFRSDPKGFFDTLADDLIEATLFDDDGDISAERLSEVTVRFLETSLNKLLYDAQDPDMWQVAKRIAESLVQLADYNIVTDSDDLNDMLWSVVHQFAHFIDLEATNVPESVYEQLQQDLIDGSHVLLALEEQEEYIQSKAERLAQMLVEARARVHAYDAGLLA